MLYQIICVVIVEIGGRIFKVFQGFPPFLIFSCLIFGNGKIKCAELLNVHFGYMEAPAVEAPAEPELAPNEYIGVAQGFGGEIKVKVTMDGDKISKIDVLSHSDTAGICDPAYATIPQAIIDAQSTTVDAVANATVSSKGIMAAVENALAQVK